MIMVKRFRYTITLGLIVLVALAVFVYRQATDDCDGIRGWDKYRWEYRCHQLPR